MLAATPIAIGIILLSILLIFKEICDGVGALVLKRSIFTIAIPILIIYLLILTFPFISFIVPAVFFLLLEEVVKVSNLYAIKDKSESFKFFLISTFGAWECLLVKPYIFYKNSSEFVNAGDGYLYALFLVVPPIIMHTCTAAIYAKSKNSIFYSFLFCAIFHFLFNATRDFYFSAGNFRTVSIVFIIDIASMLIATSLVIYIFRRFERANASDM